MVRLRNLEYLHKVQKLRNEKLETENRQLRVRIVELESVVSSQQKMIEDLKLQMEELKIMVFGKRRDKKTIDDDELDPPKEVMERDHNSYKRPIPKDTEVTEVRDHPIDACICCHGAISKKTTTVFFEEDIPLPTSKIVLKHIVQKGYC